MKDIDLSLIINRLILLKNRLNNLLCESFERKKITKSLMKSKVGHYFKEDHLKKICTAVLL